MSIRHPAVAGTFYPAEPNRLIADIRGYLTSVGTPELDFVVRTLIVPHAGYIYSGLVAAHAYRCLETLTVSRIVLLGPAHYVPFTGLTLPGVDYMETPLGAIPVDQELVSLLLADSLVADFPEAHRREHSLEVQLPFLQVVAPEISVVPMLTGAITPSQGADVLAPLLDSETLLLISSDLSHYYDAATARRLDAATAAAISRVDGAALDRESACGQTAVQIALELANRRGYRASVLDLRNSSDTAGPPDRVVGYGAFALGDG